MRRLAGILMVLGVGACGPTAAPANGNPDGGEQLLVTTCVADSQCPAGMVCEGCTATDQTCVPGCREDAQCPTNMRCNAAVLCTQCPCAPGWCDLDPCRDVDGDGYAPTTDDAVSCPGKQKGDCDDARPQVNPGLPEVCANGLDDDCDGQWDSQDDACRVCDSNQRSCSVNRSCGAGSMCDRGCCEACAAPSDPQCDPGLCVLPGGVNPDTGCALASVCGDCKSCPATVSRVCGLNGATYDNACLAEAAGTQVLYGGSCYAGEQQRCTAEWECQGAQYCRDAATDGGFEGRCTKLHTCVQDVDCAKAVPETVLCPDGGIAPLGCEVLRCVTRCG